MKNFKKVICSVIFLILVLSVSFTTMASNLGTNLVEMKYNNSSIAINGIETDSDEPIQSMLQVKEGKTWIPLRYILEALDNEVQYNKETRMINIIDNSPKLEGLFYAKCIEENTINRATNYTFEIKTNNGTKTGDCIGGNFEVNKFYGMQFDEPIFIIDGNGQSKEVNLRLNGW